MRSNPADFTLVAPSDLQGALALMTTEGERWVPIAGGTDLMVEYAAGALRARRLMSIARLPELRRTNIAVDEIQIGAGSTYTDLRQHETIAHEFPMLAQAAGWVGGVANQNRGTIGGNIVNASPAGDSLPALLAYGAELILVSVSGDRRVPYTTFHTGYKKIQLAPNELIRAVCLPRRFLGYVQHARKVGTRNAQAVSKIALAALARMDRGIVRDVRIALGSVAPVPMRLAETEQILTGKSLDDRWVALAAKAAAGEVKPIDDIRSTARYRRAVVGNLVVEFLGRLRAEPAATAASNETLARWNAVSADAAEGEILACCGSRAWARAIVTRRPLADESAVLAASDEICASLRDADWLEAFRAHPRIGENKAEESGSQRSAVWSAQEQSGAAAADAELKALLAEGNREYERRFGRIFIVCATAKTSAAILAILRKRLQNDDRSELREAAEQQRQITELRLRKWLRA
ncbi:MAG: 2-oxo-4-hydroxy-4-carboxy-5-ureidoimidazoline decarboxylase [Candidatus Acidiferrales bacterium]